MATPNLHITSSLAQKKAQLVETIHFLHAKGWAPATSSNYSFREMEDLYISASGLDKGAFTGDDLIQTDRAGRVINDSRKTSAETGLHTMIYELVPEAECILHTHSLYSTILSRIHQPDGKLTLQGYEILKGLNGIRTHETVLDVPIFQNDQDIDRLAHQIRTHWNDRSRMRVFLLASHGMYTWGNSIAEAKRHVEVFEYLFEATYRIALYEQTL
ncbi:MAG: methylthioribulose 1-phosphate dehydratase [Bacteroidota bacterium]